MNNSSFKVYNASAGSGKTFTLVKEYLKILLLTQSNFTFQNILAITFTNKAAAEMKERILTALRSFSEGVHDALLEIFVVETKLPPALIQQKSTKILQNILQNYAAFNITTIDSFTHKLIRTFAYDLGLPLNFEVEMDGKKLLSEAVDLLISRIGEKKELTDLLIDFSFQKIAEDTSWDFTKKITEVALLLLNEDDTKELGKVGPKTIEDFKQVKIKLLKEKKNIENEFSELAAAVLQLIDNSGVNRKDFYHADYPNYFIRISAVSSIKITSLIEPSKRLKENMEKEVFYSKSASKFSATAIDSIAVELKEFYWKSQKLIQEKYGNYLLIKLVLKNLIPMATLHYIKEELEGIKTQNSICLSS